MHWDPITLMAGQTLRLHPSIPKEAKYAFNDDTLPDGTPVRKGDELDPVAMRLVTCVALCAGDLVLFLPWVMGRLEE